MWGTMFRVCHFNKITFEDVFYGKFSYQTFAHIAEVEVQKLNTLEINGRFLFTISWSQSSNRS